MRLYLVRHGQTVWNATNKAQGHCEVPLDQTGFKQAQMLAGALAATDIERILSSDLSRCQETLAPYSGLTNVAPEYRHDLRERTFGSMEGQDYTELHVWMKAEGVKMGIPDWEVRPPHGESMADVWNRLAAVEQELREETRSTLVVSHGGALAQLLARLLKGTHETPRAFKFSNCGITVLEKRHDGSMLLVAFNSVEHLAGIDEGC